MKKKRFAVEQIVAILKQAELGTIEPGKKAEILVIDGDPLASMIYLRHADSRVGNWIASCFRILISSSETWRSDALWGVDQKFLLSVGTLFAKTASFPQRGDLTTDLPPENKMSAENSGRMGTGI